MNAEIEDPIARAAFLIVNASAEPADADTEHTAILERRLKQDIFASIARVKPAIAEAADFDTQVMSGEFFRDLSAPLQGIAIARCEGALAFYNRIGWHPAMLDAPLTDCVPEDAMDNFKKRYHARTLHDLAYVHPKHFEKMLGKAGAASLWETLKQYTTSLPSGN